MQEQLTGRQSAILKLIIQEYVRTGRAIGSKALIERYQLGVSPATVRNEMSELEEQQYLHHLHTSAGRVPTDRGYRYFIEHLLEEQRLPVSDEIMIRHQFRQVEMQVESWGKLAASILAEVSGNVSVVTPPRTTVERLRHFELISLRDQVVLLILVTQSGKVHESIIPVTEPIEQADLSVLSQRLNPDLRNLTYVQVEERAAGANGLAAIIVQHLATVLRVVEREGQSEMFSEGLDRALRQPEFIRQAAVAQRLLELLRGGAILAALLPQIEAIEDVQVFIGSENESVHLRPFGVVVATYGADSDLTGLLGVLGPTRMPYGRSISTVRYLAHLLSELLREVYAVEDDEAS